MKIKRKNEMTHDIILPIKKEVCKKIKHISAQIITGCSPIMFLTGWYGFFTLRTPELELLSLMPVLIGFFIMMWWIVGEHTILESLYNKHRIQFKCKCDKEKDKND